MKVGFDTFYRHTVSAKRGIGRYGENLLGALTRLGEGDEYIPFEPDCDPFDKAAWARELKRFLADQHPDIYLIPSPFEYSRPLPGRDVLGSCKLATVIHDFIPLRFPKAYLSKGNRPWYEATVDFLRNADLLLANSQTTRGDAEELVGLDKRRIQVIYGGVSPKFSPGAVNAAVLAKVGITRPYLLYVGAFDYRKNVEGLVTAWAKVCVELPSRPQLVLPSSDAPERVVEKLKEITAAHGLGARDLLLPGHVSDEELIHLYRGAALFTLPSLWEGFGLPVVEAMACGTPVLTSANSSLAEVAGDAALLVDPTSVASIAEGMLSAFQKPALMSELRARGRRRAALFTWEATARRTSMALRA